MVPVDQIELEYGLWFLAMVRCRVERRARPARRIRTSGQISRHFEREHPRHIRLERQYLQVVHQLDMFVERIRNANRSLWDLSLLAARVLGFDPFDPSLDFTEVLQVLTHPPPILSTQL